MEILKDFNISWCWNSQALEICFKNWNRRDFVWKVLLCFICWEIWKHRKTIMFEDKEVFVWKVVLRDSSTFGEYFKERDMIGRRNPSPPSFNLNLHVGFFDGASQEASGKHGVGVVLRFTNSLC